MRAKPPDCARPAASPVAPDTLVGYRLRRLHGVFQDSWREFFGALGVAVTPVQGGILLLIERDLNRLPGLTQTELARELRIEAPTLHEQLKRLIDAGLVTRTSRTDDRRTHTLALTVAGLDAVEAIRVHIAEQEALALAPLTAAERHQLAALLDRVLAQRDG